MLILIQDSYFNKDIFAKKWVFNENRLNKTMQNIEYVFFKILAKSE